MLTCTRDTGRILQHGRTPSCAIMPDDLVGTRWAMVQYRLVR
jgi:hypothetical protein